MRKEKPRSYFVLAKAVNQLSSCIYSMMEVELQVIVMFKEGQGERKKQTPSIASSGCGSLKPDFTCIYFPSVSTSAHADCRRRASDKWFSLRVSEDAHEI